MTADNYSDSGYGCGKQIAQLECGCVSAGRVTMMAENGLTTEISSHPEPCTDSGMVINGVVNGEVVTSTVATSGMVINGVVNGEVVTSTVATSGMVINGVVNGEVVTSTVATSGMVIIDVVNIDEAISADWLPQSKQSGEVDVLRICGTGGDQLPYSGCC